MQSKLTARSDVYFSSVWKWINIVIVEGAAITEDLEFLFGKRIVAFALKDCRGGSFGTCQS